MPPAGALLVDKPAGPTSHDVVARVRRALRLRAVGHTGTLDPFASGLLVVVLGRATRLARFVEGRPKTYLGTARLGVRTNTDDGTGTPVAGADPSGVSAAEIAAALATMLGTTAQRPPSFSAKRVGGERSYRLARRGEAVPLAEVSVTVHALSLVAYTPPDITFRATVSAGTYIRALARDLGERLGVGAHLRSLRREAIGELRVEEAVTLDEIDPAKVVPAHEMLRHLSRVALSAEERRAVSHGRRIRRDDLAPIGDRDEPVVLMADGTLVAVATVRDGLVQPMVVLDTP